MLMNSRDELRIVKRASNKSENPGLWDKTVGGHVIAEGNYNQLDLKKLFDKNLAKELEEELEVNDTIIARDAIHYHSLLASGSIDLRIRPVVRLIDYDPWCPSLRQVANKEVDRKPWWKRHHVAIYAGIYEGEFHYRDGEAQDQKCIPRSQILEKIQRSPEKYTYDLRLLIERYYHLLAPIHLINTNATA